MKPWWRCWTGSKLTAIRDQLDGLLDEAARSKMTLREALGFFVPREIARRDERRISMASKIAQFPFVRELDGSEFDAQPSLDPGQIRELAPCRWIAHGDTTLRDPAPRHGATGVVCIRTRMISAPATLGSLGADVKRQVRDAVERAYLDGDADGSRSYVATAWS
jgi:hypothetical protein